MEIPVSLVVFPLSLPRRALLMAVSCAMVLPAQAVLSVQPAPADVQVTDAWVRPAVKGQSGTGGYMRLLSPAGATLVGFSSPVAGVAELHEMSMMGDVMRMRPVPSLTLPAGQVVALKPGGYHLMLMQLKQPLKVGDQVPLTLRFKAADGSSQLLSIQVPIRMAAPDSTAPASVPSSGQGHHQGHHRGQ